MLLPAFSMESPLDLALPIAVGENDFPLGTVSQALPALPPALPSLITQNDETKIDYYQVFGDAPPGDYDPTTYTGVTLEFQQAQTKTDVGDEGFFDLA